MTLCYYKIHLLVRTRAVWDISNETDKFRSFGHVFSICFFPSPYRHGEVHGIEHVVKYFGDIYLVFGLFWIAPTTA